MKNNFIALKVEVFSFDNIESHCDKNAFQLLLPARSTGCTKLAFLTFLAFRTLWIIWMFNAGEAGETRLAISTFCITLLAPAFDAFLALDAIFASLAPLALRSITSFF